MVQFDEVLGNENFLPEMNPLEAQRQIDQLKHFGLKDIGTSKWMKQREVVNMLNIQAHQNAALNQDEYIAQGIISSQKVEVLIKELITVEIWKNKVTPLIKEELTSASKQSIKPYLIYYHEATLVNLLECVMYHKDAIIYCEESILIELVDYCQRKFNVLIHNKKLQERHDQKDILKLSDEEIWQDQIREIEFNCCMYSLTIFRFITDNLKEISPSVVHRILEKHDSPIALVYIIENSPFKKKEKSGFKKYNGNIWETVSFDEYLKVTQYEAQVWLAINNLLVDPETRNKYEYTTFRRETVIGLKKYLTDVLIDQIPVLVDLLRNVENLQIMNLPVVSKNILMVEAVAEFSEAILNGTDFEKIAQEHLLTICNTEDDEARREEIMSMAKMFGNMLDLMGENADYEQLKL
ncbi:hypothetical protein FDP41_007512 [Naegleria fowleri]|uniref:Uncharacterized protein n=1 Tax=Naegleria fowleri TaxID=5763 RepID=A0A6A5CGE3_NAEFO|nr:uncharacterized protein FDP41_007512 [Naegleria fowleri]KAF0984335.1 hypothetical protein FDP41_007512 [Naegleria fowleri]